MKIDIHCHATGRGKNIENIDKNVYFNIDDDPSWATRKYFDFLYDVFESNLVRMGGDTDADRLMSTQEYFDLVYRLFVSSKELDGIVLLALDAVYTNGDVDEKATDLWVSNSFLNRKVSELNKRIRNEGIESKRFFFGASVNPNNKAWREELRFVIDNTEAVLIKWIPSVQHIKIQEVKEEFYKELAKAKMPLLCHIGPEHAFPEGPRHKEDDDYRLLKKPLESEVKVIAAHCNTPILPVLEKNEIEAFRKFMEEANRDRIRIWADTSALSAAFKAFYVQDIVDSFNHDWLVHGSDFPIPVDGWSQIPWVNPAITSSEYREILRTRNPFDRDVLIKRARGFKDTILENTEKVLRMPD